MRCSLLDDLGIILTATADGKRTSFPGPLVQILLIDLMKNVGLEEDFCSEGE